MYPVALILLDPVRQRLRCRRREDNYVKSGVRETLRLMRIATILICFLLPLTAPRASASDRDVKPRIERVSFSSRADGMGYVIRLHTTDKIEAVSVPRALGSNRFRLTVFRTELSPHPTLDPPAGPVRSYRVDEIGGNVEFVFEMSVDGVASTVYRDRSGNDILVNLVTTPVETAPTAAPVRSTGPSQTASERWKIDTIVIDAGHGGKDIGATRGSVREKDVVLAVALKLGQYLKEKENVNIVYTRSDDRFVELSERGRIANEAGGKLFISLHANAARSRRAYGTETFFLGMHKTDAARQVMERENEVINLETDQNRYDHLDQTGMIQQTLAQSVYMRQSEQLAGLIENQFENRVGRKSRGVKQAGFYVLYGASMPAVLVELGFITNAGEASFLASKDGQTYLASAIFRSIREFKYEYEKALQLANN